jgi:hypothetical protein
MNIYEDTNPRELKELLYQIHHGDTVLPDFQRDFVWDPNATTDLIVSIAQNYPAGSLLRIRNTQNLFAYREFQGAPSINGKKPIYLILDGQQRLTSLYQAFYGVGENRYYLDLHKLLEGDEFEDCIFNLKEDHKRVAEYVELSSQASSLILPLSVLKGGGGDYSKWVRNIARLQPAEKDRLELEDKLDAIDDWIQTIDDYRFPVVTLSDSTSAEAVCTIFETLNRTGVKLSPFELLTARYWHKAVNLRQLWATAKQTYSIIEDFAIDPYYVLQIVSLIGRPTPSIKRSDILNLEVGVISKWWDPAVEGLKDALTFLQNECGVLTPGLLPYNTIVIPLAALFARCADLSGPSVGTFRDRIARWFWCAVFGQKYESSPTSQSVLDFTEFMSWMQNGAEPDTVISFRFDPLALRSVTGRQRAVYRGVLALVLKRHSKDFHSNETLTLDIITTKHVDDHHIFPNKYLERKGVDAKLRDCVLNHTLIDPETNRSISDLAPSVYLKTILDEWSKNPMRGEIQFNQLLESHLLPTGSHSPFWTDNFESFLAWRQEQVWKEIRQVTGI